MHMAIEAYGQNGNQESAIARYEALGDSADEVLSYVVQNPEGLSNDLILSYSEVVASGAPTTAEAETGEGEAEGGTRNLLPILIPLLCVLLLVLVAFLVYFFILRGRIGRKEVTEPSPVMEAMEAQEQAVYTDYVAEGTEPPLAQFMASYKFGDDLFDDAFSVDSASGEFLGECGVGISETIGVGDPKKVSAFEVWLFDKNDIQTVTKVLMSPHTFNDEGTRQRLEAKGEPVSAEPGSETLLETQTLQLVARVVDMGYGDGSMPDQSYFDHLVLELAVWPK